MLRLLAAAELVPSVVRAAGFGFFGLDGEES